MPEQSKWSWLSAKRAIGNVTGAFDGRRGTGNINPPDDDEENPWFQLGGHARAVDSPLQDIAADDRGWSDASSRTASKTASARWLSETSSPLGFSDEDGTLKQVDSQNWRRAFGTSKSKRFVPKVSSSTGKGTSRWPVQNPPAPVRGVTARRSRGSTWLLQAGCAAALVIAGLYTTHSASPLAMKLRGVFSSAFTQDYATNVIPTVNQFLEKHHINVPVNWMPSSAIQLHVPLDGSVKTDYSPTHPEMVLEGSANGAVYAAGSGTVMQVEKLSTGTMISIDHGSLGTTLYFGLGMPTVKVHQYVFAGQIIGRLPNTTHPDLRFSLEKNNHNENPHDYISFPNDGV